MHRSAGTKPRGRVWFGGDLLWRLVVVGALAVLAAVGAGGSVLARADAGVSGGRQTPESPGPFSWRCSSVTIPLGIDTTAAYDPNRFGVDAEPSDGLIKDVSVFLYVPDRPGRYPVVEMSHGAGDSRADWTVWGQRLASRGMVAILLDRRNDTYPPPSSCHSTKPLTGVDQQAVDNPDMAGIGSYNVNSADILRVLKWAVKQNSAVASPLYHKIDSNRLAITGHSIGGWYATLAAYLSSTHQIDPDTGRRDWPKLSAVVLFDPTSLWPAPNASTQTHAHALSIPTAVVGSEGGYDCNEGLVAGPTCVQYTSEAAFAALQPRLDKLGVKVVGGQHSEAENPDDDDLSPNPVHQELYMRYAMAWLEYWLQNSCTATPYLNGSASAADQRSGLIKVVAGSSRTPRCHRRP